MTPTGGKRPNDFSDPTDQSIRTQCAMSWKIVVSEWRSVITVSLNVGGGVKTVHVHANTLHARRRRTHGASCARPWFRTAEPLGERRYETWITHIQCPKAALLFWFFGDFRCGALLFMVIHVIYKYKNK